MPSRTKKSPAPASARADKCGPKIMDFTVEGAGNTYRGKLTVPDDDGTSHLPMMIVSLLPQLVGSSPELCGATSITITAVLKPS